MITIEIENPIEVAGNASPLARALGGLAPGMVRRKVDEQVAEVLREKLAERGIRARIEIR